MNKTFTATVRYSPGQLDDEGQPVSTEPFQVEFEIDMDAGMTSDYTPIDAIADTGDVQFDWILCGISE